MVKPKYLYHGSGRELTGERLMPRKAGDVNGDSDNSLNAVYATSIKKWAMIMGILSEKGVRESGTHVMGKRKIKAVVHSGWPKQKYFYLYTLASKTFKEKPKGSAQWISFESVKPTKIQKIPTKKYLHWISKNEK